MLSGAWVIRLVGQNQTVPPTQGRINMMFHIFANGDLIASFKDETDRDICLDALREYWGEEMEQTFTIKAE